VFSSNSIRKRYGGREVIKGASICVASRGVTVLIGPSGGGKSTLLRTMSLLEYPDAGVVQIDDASYQFPRDAERRDISPWPKVTVVFQQHFLWPHMTIRNNIYLPARRHEDYEARVAALAAAFDMTKVLDRYPNEASVGQRQRAALMRGLALNPHYILLDEITAALDVEQSGKILRYFLDGGGQEIGILIVTHLLGFARRLISVRGGGTVYFMDDGIIVEHGGTEILSRPETSRLRGFIDAEGVIA
jgi:L-cystine transport system ATP-binding protein